MAADVIPGIIKSILAYHNEEHEQNNSEHLIYDSGIRVGLVLLGCTELPLALHSLFPQIAVNCDDDTGGGGGRKRGVATSVVATMNQLRLPMHMGQVC